MNPRRFWLKESRRWTQDALQWIAAGDKPIESTSPLVPASEAGACAMYAACDAFKAYPDLREVPQVPR